MYRYARVLSCDEKEGRRIVGIGNACSAPRAAQNSKKILSKPYLPRHVFVELRGPAGNDNTWRSVIWSSGMSPTCAQKAERMDADMTYLYPCVRFRSTNVRVFSKRVIANPSNGNRRPSATNECRTLRISRPILSHDGQGIRRSASMTLLFSVGVLHMHSAGRAGRGELSRFSGPAYDDL